MLRQSSCLLLIIFLVSGCSQDRPTYIKSCKNIEKPKWLNDEYVGISRITASSSKTEQKQIAIKRAIATLLMTKGNSKGNSIVSMQRELTTSNKDEFFAKRFKENSSIKINFKNINYDIKISDIWEDPCTKEIYVNIKEK